MSVSAYTSAVAPGSDEVPASVQTPAVTLGRNDTPASISTPAVTSSSDKTPATTHSPGVVSGNLETSTPAYTPAVTPGSGTKPASIYFPAITPSSATLFMCIHDTFELLENVLACLPLSDLHTARDINRTIRQTIARSVILQVKLFRRPAPKPKKERKCILGSNLNIGGSENEKARLLVTDGRVPKLIAANPDVPEVTLVTMNPLLFWPYFTAQIFIRKGRGHTVCANGANTDITAPGGPKSCRFLDSTVTDLAKRISKGGIWGSMYITQPPVTDVELDIHGYTGADFRSETWRVSVGNPSGVTCLDVFNAVRKPRHYGHVRVRIVETISFPGVVGLSLEEMEILEEDGVLEK